MDISIFWVWPSCSSLQSRLLHQQISCSPSRLISAASLRYSGVLPAKIYARPLAIPMSIKFAASKIAAAPSTRIATTLKISKFPTTLEIISLNTRKPLKVAREVATLKLPRVKGFTRKTNITATLLGIMISYLAYFIRHLLTEIRIELIGFIYKITAPP